jgi:hypothetical protein
MRFALAHVFEHLGDEEADDEVGLCTLNQVDP